MVCGFVVQIWKEAPEEAEVLSQSHEDTGGGPELQRSLSLRKMLSAISPRLQKGKGMGTHWPKGESSDSIEGPFARLSLGSRSQSMRAKGPRVLAKGTIENVFTGRDCVRGWGDG